MAAAVAAVVQQAAATQGVAESGGLDVLGSDVEGGAGVAQLHPAARGDPLGESSSPRAEQFAAKGLGEPDFAFFQDYPCLFQKPRSAEEDALFKQGLSLLHQAPLVALSEDAGAGKLAPPRERRAPHDVVRFGIFGRLAAVVQRRDGVPESSFRVRSRSFRDGDRGVTRNKCVDLRLHPASFLWWSFVGQQLSALLFIDACTMTLSRLTIFHSPSPWSTRANMTQTCRRRWPSTRGQLHPDRLCDDPGHRRGRGPEVSPSRLPAASLPRVPAHLSPVASSPWWCRACAVPIARCLRAAA